MLIHAPNGQRYSNSYLVSDLSLLSRMGEDKCDNELAKLTRVLEKLAKKKDVRKFIPRIRKFDKLRFSPKNVLWVNR